jgi:hypothetical protein
MFKLVNIEDSDLVVAVQEELKVGGGFGDIYRGRYMVRGTTPFEYFRYVVAKKNKSPSRRIAEPKRTEEVKTNLIDVNRI